MSRALFRSSLPIVVVAGLILLGASPSADAQRGDTARVGQRTGGAGRPLPRRGLAERQGAGGEARAQATPAARQRLERQVKQTLARVVRRELKLDDAKMQSLQQTDSKYDPRRRALLRNERAARQGLRAALSDSTGAADDRIPGLMDQLIQVQRERADLLDAEQRDLGTFLSPRQRAQYMALRERVTELLATPRSGGAGGRRGGPPPVR